MLLLSVVGLPCACLLRSFSILFYSKCGVCAFSSHSLYVSTVGLRGLYRTVCAIVLSTVRRFNRIKPRFIELLLRPGFAGWIPPLLLARSRVRWRTRTLARSPILSNTM
jgi:hypothetical protein